MSASVNLFAMTQAIHEAYCVRNNIPVERKTSDEDLVPMFGRVILTDAELAVLVGSQP